MMSNIKQDINWKQIPRQKKLNIRKTYRKMRLEQIKGRESLRLQAKLFADSIENLFGLNNVEKSVI